MADWSRNLSRIELRRESIESPGVNGFELRGIGVPLIRCDLQPIKDGRQSTVDVAALVVADDATGPVDQRQVFLEVEQNSIMELVRQPVFKVQ